MEDRSLSIWLIVLFGVSGLAIVILTWLWPVIESGKITATLTGSAGLFIATIKALVLKRSSDNTDEKPVPVRIEAEDKS